MLKNLVCSFWFSVGVFIRLGRKWDSTMKPIMFSEHWIRKIYSTSLVLSSKFIDLMSIKKCLMTHLNLDKFFWNYVGVHSVAMCKLLNFTKLIVWPSMLRKNVRFYYSFKSKTKATFNSVDRSILWKQVIKDLYFTWYSQKHMLGKTKLDFPN